MNLARKRFSVSGLLMGACILCISTAGGQSGRKLEGSVLDQSGGVVPGATVILFSYDRVRTAKTDDQGEFAFANFPPGSHYLEAKSQEFFSASIPITDKMTERLSVTLEVGFFTNHVEISCDPKNYVPISSASYEERSGRVQLSGTVGEPRGRPLANTNLTLVQADLGAPLGTWNDPSRSPAMWQRSFKEVVVAKVTTNKKGEFQFADLELVWYRLKAARDGYSNWDVPFWIARETQTRLSRIYLFPNSETNPCGLPGAYDFIGY